MPREARGDRLATSALLALVAAVWVAAPATPGAALGGPSLRRRLLVWLTAGRRNSPDLQRGGPQLWPAVPPPTCRSWTAPGFLLAEAGLVW
jgi:hypothetical protein